jgi:hypothetical protein
MLDTLLCVVAGLAIVTAFWLLLKAADYFDWD